MSPVAASNVAPVAPETDTAPPVAEREPDIPCTTTAPVEAINEQAPAADETSVLVAPETVVAPAAVVWKTPCALLAPVPRVAVPSALIDTPAALSTVNAPTKLTTPPVDSKLILPVPFDKIVRFSLATVLTTPRPTPAPPADPDTTLSPQLEFAAPATVPTENVGTTSTTVLPPTLRHDTENAAGTIADPPATTTFKGPDTPPPTTIGCVNTCGSVSPNITNPARAAFIDAAYVNIGTSFNKPSVPFDDMIAVYVIRVYTCIDLLSSMDEW
jgi:hypothetical protein